MINREYIISRALESKIAIAENNHLTEMSMTLDVIKEINAILKKKEPKEPIKDERFKSMEVYRCAKCLSIVSHSSSNYCSNCGQAVKLELTSER